MNDGSYTPSPELREFGWGECVLPTSSRLPFLGNDAMEKLVADYQFDTILDIGCGHGRQTRFLRERGRTVTALNIGHHPEFEPDILGDYMEVEFEPFDAIWCCHVLEHVRNFGSFIDKLFRDLKDDGVLAITVPPGKHNIVSGHVTLWTPGLLLYNLVLSGFDCREAAVKVYGGNISVIVCKRSTSVARTQFLIERLEKFFPFPVYQGFDGRVAQCNW